MWMGILTLGFNKSTDVYNGVYGLHISMFKRFIGEAYKFYYTFLLIIYSQSDKGNMFDYSSLWIPSGWVWKGFSE